MTALAAVLLAAVAPALAFTGVTVIDGTGAPARSGQTVLVADGRIVAAGAPGAVTIPAGARVVDGRGKYLVPGLWDAHVHLATRSEERLAEDILLPAYLAHGIVGVRDMGGDPVRVLALRRAVAKGELEGPEIITPGPFVDAPWPEPSALVAGVAGADGAHAAVARLTADGADFVKVQAGLSPAAHAAIAREAAAAGLPVMGHVPEAVSALAVAEAGQRSIEHVSPALPGDAGLMMAASAREEELRAELLALRGLEARTDEERAAARARDRALQEALAGPADPARFETLARRLVSRGVVVVPTLVWSRRLRPLGREDVGSDLAWDLVPRALRERWRAGRAQSAAGADDGQLALAGRVADASSAFVGRLHRAGVRIAAGTDSVDALVHPGSSLHEELELLVAAGLSPLDALRAATSEVAVLLGRRDAGTIAPGQRGDLVLLDADPLADIRNTRRVAAVVKAGRLYDSGELDRLRAAVLAAAAR